MRSDNTTLEEELLLYAVTDRSWLGDRTLYEQVELALKGGATFLQLREKSAGNIKSRSSSMTM